MGSLASVGFIDSSLGTEYSLGCNIDILFAAVQINSGKAEDVDKIKKHTHYNTAL